MILKGEKEAVESVIAHAETYGYGNLIAHLRQRWALKLVRDGISERAAIYATNVTPYPLMLDYLELNKCD